MKTKREFTAVAVLLLATTLTLITAVEHHKNIAIVYGQIANLFVPLIALSSFILGAFISLIFQWGINVIQFEKVARLLPADESAVMKLLFNKRTLTQTDLSSETGLSRLIVSRIVSRLEDKGIVNKKPLANTNLIESRLYRIHPTTQTLTRLPGLSEKRVVIAISTVFLFGISLSILNSFHVLVLKHPLEPSLYLLTIEFFALGGLTNLLIRTRISNIQFESILSILTKDERELLRMIYLKKSVTQNELVEKTGVYKMKVSRILKKFEQKGVIEKKPHGYINVILSKI